MRSRHQVAQAETDMRWSADGRFLYYVSRDEMAMMEVELESGPAFIVKAEHRLFDIEPLGVRHFREFDVTGDGQEFILERNPQGVRGKKAFTVVENWYEEFRETP